MLTIHKDFSGASIGEYTIVDRQILAKLREEKITCADGMCHDYNYHFSFGIENKSDSATEIEIFINCTEREQLPEQTALLFCADSPEDEFKIFKCKSRTNLKKSYYISFILEGHQTLYIANTYFRQYEKLVPMFDRLAELGHAICDVIGHSIEGRELVCYSYSNVAFNTESGTLRPAILVTSGFHPPEQDTLATEAIMEYLATDEARNARNLFDFYIVPIANPDGFVHGYNGCNAAEINFCWKFDENDKINCPEAYYLWKLVEKIQPIVYFDFHGYTFQLSNKQASPYIKPLIFYEGRSVRKMINLFNTEIVALTEGHAGKGLLTYAPSTPWAKITKKYNTITYAKFHIHLMDGINESKKLAVDSLKLVVELLAANEFINPLTILKKPFGYVRKNHVMEIFRKLILLWTGKIRPVLGSVKNKTFPQ